MQHVFMLPITHQPRTAPECTKHSIRDAPARADRNRVRRSVTRTMSRAKPDSRHVRQHHDGRAEAQSPHFNSRYVSGSNAAVVLKHKRRIVNVPPRLMSKASPPRPMSRIGPQLGRARTTYPETNRHTPTENNPRSVAGSAASEHMPPPDK